jgi:hypothetical protein
MYFKTILAAVATLGLASAQDSNQAGQPGGQPAAASGAAAAVPSDLSGGFKPDQLTMQVSFDNQASSGIPNGAEESTQQTSQEPTFALGDSSGVNTEIKFVIFMVDTTSSSNRVLHYVRSDFQATGEETKISSNKPPQMPWKGPGTLGENGQRQYTFLMYEQPGAFNGQGMPQNGQPVNVQDFVKQNGLQKAIAGQTMSVNVGQGTGQGSGNSTGGNGGDTGNGGGNGGGNPPAAPPAPAAPAAAPSQGSGSGPGAGSPANPTPGSGGAIGLTAVSGTGASGSVGMGASMTMSMPGATDSPSAASPSTSPSPSPSPATGAGSAVVPAGAWSVVVCAGIAAFAAGLVV